MSRRRLRFVYAQTGAMLASVLALVLLDAVSLEVFVAPTPTSGPAEAAFEVVFDEVDEPTGTSA